MLSIPLPASGRTVAPASSEPHAAATVAADVVVYGGTPAGVAAAVAAARGGARVVLVEPRTHIGGMMSNGLGWTDRGDVGVIGGLAAEFFDRTEAIEWAAGGRWAFQPATASEVFGDMLAEAGVTVRLGQRLLRTADGVSSVGGRVLEIRTTTGASFSASVFVDATYEGDLMAAAGVTYRVGRESKAEYGESRAGVRPATRVMDIPPGLELGFPVSAPGAPASADGRIQSSNFRLCMTKDPNNRVLIPKPAGYDPDQYEVVAEYIAQRAASGLIPRANLVLHMDPIGGGKWDVNQNGSVSFGLPGANLGYPEGSYGVRAEIEAIHRGYQKGFLYFIAHDPRMPLAIRTEMASYGLCADEFTDNGNWPRMMYLREARRLVGRYVATQHDVQALVSKPDTIGLASYRLDAHTVSRWVGTDGDLYAEGRLGSSPVRRWSIPYRSLTPHAHEASNLLVAVGAGASHVAHASLRMEPQYMIMGQAAGTAAAMAAARLITVQAVPVAELQARLRAAGAVLDDPGDIADSFYEAIAWAYHEGITSGCAPALFCPDAALPRGQMAALLARALDLPGTEIDFFVDDTDTTHEDDINRVAAAGITFGCTAERYCPMQIVTREQMASFLARAFRLAPTDEDFFIDDEASTHEVSINRLAASGITAGCTETRFCPTRVVTRGQTLAFLYRHYDGGPSGGWTASVAADEPTTDLPHDPSPSPSPTPTPTPSLSPTSSPSPSPSHSPSPTSIPSPSPSLAPGPTPTPTPSPSPSPSPSPTPIPTPAPSSPEPSP